MVSLSMGSATIFLVVQWKKQLWSPTSSLHPHGIATHGSSRQQSSGFFTANTHLCCVTVWLKAPTSTHSAAPCQRPLACPCTCWSVCVEGAAPSRAAAAADHGATWHSTAWGCTTANETSFLLLNPWTVSLWCTCKHSFWPQRQLKMVMAIPWDRLGNASLI